MHASISEDGKAKSWLSVYGKSWLYSQHFFRFPLLTRHVAALDLEIWIPCEPPYGLVSKKDMISLHLESGGKQL
jgi:hypothetical protein